MEKENKNLNIEEVKKEKPEEEFALKEEKRKARAYGMASKNFFKGLEWSKDYHATDIKNLNGYFIFYHGKNSVVHFRIKECPGWYFGIWWDSIDEENKTVKGTFFTQYERDIDKFKPTASDHTTRIEVSYRTKSYDDVWLLDCTVSYMIKYLNKHFYKAWCGYGKYTTGSGLHCWYRYIKYRWYLFKDEYLTEKASKWCVKYLKKILEELYEGEVLVSKTENQSPKYELCISYEKNKHYFDKVGNYNIFLSNEEIEDYFKELGDNLTDPEDIKLYNFCNKSKKLENKYDRKVKHFDRIASLIGIHFISIQVNKVVNVFNGKLCNNVKKYGTWWGKI